MLTVLPQISESKEKADSVLLSRMWNYRRNFTYDNKGETQNIYMRYMLDIERRNPTLFLVPTLYTIAKGERQYIGETYGKLRFDDNQQYKIQRQIVSGTISRNQKITPMMLQYLTPDLYGMTLYEDHILSPFNYSNRHFYQYRIHSTEGDLARITFRPRLNNTQLVRGSAVVNRTNGRVQHVHFEGEYDMVDFHVDVNQGVSDNATTLPLRCITDVSFRFLGNRLAASFLATYQGNTTLPDSVNEVSSREKMDSLRTVPLKEKEVEIYRRYDNRHHRDSTDTIKVTKKRENHWASTAWDIIEDHFLSSIHADAGGASLRLSPLINPQYLSYSQSRGVAYKINIGAKYRWNAYRYLTLSSRLGYNFKIKQFYFTAPLRMTYNPKRNGYAEVTWANGNRITNSSVVETISEELQDSIDYEHLAYFNDNYCRAVNNIVAFDWLEITTGMIYHRRRAVNATEMSALGKPVEYRSFAPLLTIRLTPWHKGPVFTCNYERSIKGILRSNLEYERVEIDASYKHKMHCLRVLNLRVGTGFYTNKRTNYFVDYTNFHDENLPEGWDDEWTGQFQLVNSRWYNTSDYYVRGHISYESPLLCLSWIPGVGRLIETERIYLSTLSIQHTHAYSELGYGFSTRFFSMGVFASFLNNKYKDFGCKFTFELFGKW